MRWYAVTPAGDCTSAWASCACPPRGNLRAGTPPCLCTAHLTVADGDEALALAVVEPSWTDFHVSYRVGARHPLDKGAAGRAILLGRDPAAEFAVTGAELPSGAKGLAAPIRHIAGFEGSVGIITLGDLDVERIAPEVVRAAERFVARLG